MLQTLRRWFRPRKTEVHAESPAEIEAILERAKQGEHLRIYLPAALLQMKGAFAYGGGWHPFLAALEEGPSALTWFYEAHQPRTLQEAYFLESPRDGFAPLPPWQTVWRIGSRVKPHRGECGLSLQEGVSFHGPCTPRKVRLEMQRLTGVRDSILRDGYHPDRFVGDIDGHFLRQAGEYRFYVHGGKHRTAVLAHLGHATIPVTLKRGYRHVADAAEADSWFLCRSNRISVTQARAIFARYFATNGLAQRQILLSRSGASGVATDSRAA
jgi:hypothetical protein